MTIKKQFNISIYIFFLFFFYFNKTNWGKIFSNFFGFIILINFLKIIFGKVKK
ncbi:putativel integral membrane protein [Candidatus Phytoplasma phoenicium]|uniref:Putativel integral membrane protein n=1 Tax=Candidatus Phytoplasma phoenicium TaxID=198422 RepID=A0A0L0MKT3_9MOLU|nr:putativel integral membrane protein [Candidatus Phytoplasma phoenicium]